MKNNAWYFLAIIIIIIASQTVVLLERNSKVDALQENINALQLQIAKLQAELGTGSITGYVFIDSAPLNTLGSEDKAAQGFKVELWREANESRYYLYRETEIKSDGLYEFLSLPAGEYRIIPVLDDVWLNMATHFNTNYLGSIPLGLDEDILGHTILMGHIE